MKNHNHEENKIIGGEPNLSQTETELLQSGVPDTGEKVIAWKEITQLKLEKGLVVCINGGGEFPLQITFDVCTPYYDQEKEEKARAKAHHRKIRRIYKTILSDKRLVNGRGVLLDSDIKTKLLVLLNKMPISSEQMFGYRKRSYDFNKKEQIASGFYSVPLDYYQALISLLKNGAYQNAAISINVGGHKEVSSFSIYLHPDHPDWFYR